MKILALPIIVAALAFSACSQASEPATKLAAQDSVASHVKMDNKGQWSVIKEQSHVKFTASQQGDEFTGEFKTFDALINFKADDIENASVTATIDIGSVAAGSKERDSSLPGKEWFSVKKFPQAVFESNDFIKTGENSYEARGALSMKGKSQPLTLPFTLDISGEKAEMTGKVEIDRTLWEIGTGAWSTDEWVSTKVTVDVKVSAESSK